MPTYEYRCPQGHEFEKFQKISEKPRAKCPRCGKMAERRISAGAGFVFKGSGFYITDYGKDGKGPRKADKEASGSEAPAADSTSKAQSKPEPKPKKPAAKKPSE